MKRFVKVNETIYDAFRGKPRSDEELYYLLVTEDLPEQREIVNYLNSHKFRHDFPVSDTITVRNQKVVVRSLESGVPTFSVPLDSIVGEETILHPEGLSIIPLTKAEQIVMRMLADTYCALNLR